MGFLHRIRHDSDGFTLVEAMVSLVIIFGLLVVLLRTFDTGTRVIVETRRQASASAFASELIERAQALEWGQMGLATATRGNDCGTEQVGCYINNPFIDLTEPSALTYQFGGEDVVFSNSDTFQPFLNFHEEVARDDTTFDRYLFVTSIRDVAGREIARRLTAVVQWIPPSGFREEVRLGTIVSQYQVPSQPLISGTVEMSPGSIVFQHRDETLQNGSVAPGTEWVWFTTSDVTDTIDDEYYLDESVFRQAFNGSISMPGQILTATSDFVSSTGFSTTGVGVSDLRWFGPDGLWDTPDDVLIIEAPNTLTLQSDDDASSLPDLNYGGTGLFLNEPMAAFSHIGAEDQDIIVAEATGGALQSLTPSGYDFDGDLWSEHNDVANPPVDMLPYAELDAIADVPEQIVVGFRDYVNPPAQWELVNLYGGAFPVLGTAEIPEYNFTLVRRGATGGAAYDFAGSVDRSNTFLEERSIDAAMSYDGGTIRFLDDDAYRGAGSGRSSKFRGWLVVIMPQIEVIQVQAGEGPVLSPVMTVGTDLVINQWDPSIDDYVEIYREPYTNLKSASCNVPQISRNITPWSGSPVATELRSPNNPWLTYEVQADITVHGWCFNTAGDTLGNRRTALFQTDGPIIEVNIEKYFVQDRAIEEVLLNDPVLSPYGDWAAVGRVTLFDFEFDFVSERLTVTSVFIDPEAN